MTDIEQIFEGNSAGKTDKIMALCERLEKIDGAISRIKYNDALVTEVPELLKTLGAAKDAVIAGLKAL